jgi:hypothetical protein
VVIFIFILKWEIFLANTDKSDDDEFEATKDIENIHFPSLYLGISSLCVAEVASIK